MHTIKWLVCGLVLSLTGCGTLDSKTDQLRVGDSQSRVLEVMGSPDRKMTNNADQEGWQYCVSGAKFGMNDHKDMVFRDGKLLKIDSYASHQTACSLNMRPIVWAAPSTEKILVAFKKACTDFGFIAGTDNFAQCMLSQQQQYHGMIQAQSGRQIEAARIDAENSRQAQANMQAQLERQNQQQQFQQQQLLRTISQPAAQPANSTVFCNTYGNMTTCRQ